MNMVENLSHHDQNMVKAFNQGRVQLDFANPIYDLINEKFYKKTGGKFTALPFPTGIGKTYNIVSLILQFLLDEIDRELIESEVVQSDYSDKEKYQPRICYYITNSVDNVYETYQDLVERIKQHGELTSQQKEVLLDKILYTPSNAQTLFSLFQEHSEALEQTIEIFKVEENKRLFADLRQIKNEYLLLKDSNLNASQKKILENSLQEKASQCYSKLIQYIQKVQRGSDAFFLKGHMHFLRYVIPGIMLEGEIQRTRVVFMTTKKFLFGLWQSKGKFYPSRELANNILIIDEVDRQQAEILGHLVKASDIDILAMIRTIYSNLKTHKLCNKPQYNGMQKCIEKYLEDVSQFYEANDLNYSFDLHSSLSNDELEDQNILLFSDKLSTHRTSYSQKLVFNYNKNIQQHNIGLEGALSGKEHSFPKFIGKMAKLILRDFSLLIRQLEEIYIKNLEQLEEKIDQNISSSEIVSSILDQLNMHDLKSKLLQQLDHHSSYIKDLDESGNFHNRGLKITEVDRRAEVKDSVMFKHHGFELSPTGLLAKWVKEGCSILGVSATAECESVIHNFDIKYLKSKLKSQFIELTSDDRKSIQEYYHSERNYSASNVNIHVNDIDVHLSFIKQLLKEWKPDTKNISVFYKTVLGCEDKQVNYYLSRFSKVCRAIKSFSEKDNNRYMMVMTNSIIPSNGFLAEFFQWYAEKLSKQYNVPFKIVTGINANFLKSGQFDEEVIHYLENNMGKIVALTSYETMSSGKNPDYAFNLEYENSSLNHVGSMQRNRTDVDCMYLEMPTNLISVDSDKPKITSQLLLLNYALALQEANTNSLYMTKKWIDDVLTSKNVLLLSRRIISHYYGVNSDKPNYSEDAIAAVFRLMEQTVGRAARTPTKRNNIYLFIDHELLPILAKDHRQIVVLSHEYSALRNYAHKKIHISSNVVDIEDRRRKNHAIKSTKRSLQDIHGKLNLINDFPDEKNIKKWQSLRQWVLSHPVSTEDALGEYRYLLSDTEGGYLYSQNGHEDNIKSYTFFTGMTGTIKHVNEREAMLPIIMQNKMLHQHFIEQGFCTAWNPTARYILTPPMFINIYLGALGEEAGKAVLQDINASITFEALPKEYFEQFDDVLVMNGHKALIDFKHWNLNGWRNISEDQQKSVMQYMAAKLAKLPYQKLIICNLLSDNENEPIIYFDADFNVVDDCRQAQIMQIPALLKMDGSVHFNNIKALIFWMDQ